MNPILYSSQPLTPPQMLLYQNALLWTLLRAAEFVSTRRVLASNPELLQSLLVTASIGVDASRYGTLKRVVWYFKEGGVVL